MKPESRWTFRHRRARDNDGIRLWGLQIRGNGWSAWLPGGLTIQYRKRRR